MRKFLPFLAILLLIVILVSGIWLFYSQKSSREITHPEVATLPTEKEVLVEDARYYVLKMKALLTDFSLALSQKNATALLGVMEEISTNLEKYNALLLAQVAKEQVEFMKKTIDRCTKAVSSTTQEHWAAACKEIPLLERF